MVWRYLGALARYNEQHPPKPLLRLSLQRSWGPGCGRRALSDLRAAPFAHHRRGGHGAVFGQCDRKRVLAQGDPD